MGWHGLTPFEFYAVLAVLGVAMISLIFAWILRAEVMRHPKGTPKMQEVWEAIREGAEAYLRRQLMSILPFMGLLSILLFLSVYIVPPSPEAREVFPQLDENTLRLVMGLGRAVAFILGAGFSLAVGQLGMRMAVQGNIRVAEAARTQGYDAALRLAYRAGTITGMLTNGLGLLGGSLIFLIFGIAAPDALLGFGFGGTLLALFMRVGGGIYTKAADVGADLVGKVEMDVPEDDPRNAAVVADLVGDNVGDCAGMAADIFESYEVTMVSAMILGLALRAVDPQHSMVWIIFPLLARAVGVIASIISTYTVGGVTGRRGDALRAISRGFLIGAVLSFLGFAAIGFLYARDWRVVASTTVGLILSLVIERLTDYFTSTERAPVGEIEKATRAGPATTILSGLAVGYESTVWAIVVIALTIATSTLIYWGLPPVYVLYGVSLTGIGLLMLTGNVVGMDSYGPVTDNAGGIAEMAGLEERAQEVLADLDAVGNTTKATTKGLAIATAVIAAVALFGSYLTDVSKVQAQLGQMPTLQDIGIRIDQPLVFVGLLLGGALPWLFSSFAIRAVSRAATLIVEEVRRQFRIPGVLEGTVKPDYARVVTICTLAAQKELLSLALLSVATPLVVGLVLQVEALGAFLAGSILVGQLLAVFMANAGAAWDNAKKRVENEPRDPARNLGKGSERHKASVVGDTVGDPLKDTAGPAINPMIKAVNLVSVLAAPIIVQFRGALTAGTLLAIGAAVAVLLAVLLWVIWQSKREVPELAGAPASGSGQ
ncbi:sodium-translocating pyrophosphatase [Thermoflexus hugenholtzii]|uniref:K(+)-insensitive pyrophosphate-energized proton pump n=1 Tax=Thermoflexus hugenholtzii JAD2 TaxID=877466 RepID=A0A212QUH2_9CHLR|nr:sodium-translocating pyrophosphatase [Thermoflexus hugenholtzii]SNB63340.1 K(+)-stimulated pyrophosphate-energized sodium pump [Thermoflexus hugenholtzii JAD2]